MGWWIALGVVILLGLLPLGVSVKYGADGPLVRVIAGPVRITLFPRKKKVKKEKPEKEQPAEVPVEKKTAAEKTAPAQPKQEAKPTAKPAGSQTEPRKESGGSWTDFLPLVKVLTDFLSRFRRKLRVNTLELKLIMAADDPCDLAVNYGRAWAAVGNLMPQLERLFVIKKRDIEVECDFTASETKVTARLDLTITLGRILGLVFGLLFRALYVFLKIIIKRKGGAVK